MSGLNNISLYVKRCEVYHDKQYIINACHNCKYGKVKDIKFIEKQDNYGRKYNGAILIFENWYNSSICSSLFNDLSTSKDGNAKMYHDPMTMRFWHVMIFKPRTYEDIEMNIGFSAMTLDDKNENENENENKNNISLEEMEKKYNSMISQMNYMQSQLEKAERKMMEYEQKATQDWLQVFELKSQLEEKDNEIYILNMENSKLMQEISDSTNKIAQLEQDAQYGCSMVNYLQSEINNMRNTINISCNPYTNKRIEEIV